jgi:hypothetical protein
LALAGFVDQFWFAHAVGVSSTIRPTGKSPKPRNMATRVSFTA